MTESILARSGVDSKFYSIDSLEGHAVSGFQGFVGVAHALVPEALSNSRNFGAIQCGRGFAGGLK